MENRRSRKNSRRHGPQNALSWCQSDKAVTRSHNKKLFCFHSDFWLLTPDFWIVTPLQAFPWNQILDGFVKSRISTLPRSGRGQALSFPRKRESSPFKYLWTPASAGVTRLLTFYEFINSSNRNSFLRSSLPYILKFTGLFHCAWKLGKNEICSHRF